MMRPSFPLLLLLIPSTHRAAARSAPRRLIYYLRPSHSHAWGVSTAYLKNVARGVHGMVGWIVAMVVVVVVVVVL